MFPSLKLYYYPHPATFFVSPSLRFFRCPRIWGSVKFWPGGGVFFILQGGTSSTLPGGDYRPKKQNFRPPPKAAKMLTFLPKSSHFLAACGGKSVEGGTVVHKLIAWGGTGGNFFGRSGVGGLSPPFAPLAHLWVNTPPFTSSILCMKCDFLTMSSNKPNLTKPVLAPGGIEAELI